MASAFTFHSKDETGSELGRRTVAHETHSTNK